MIVRVLGVSLIGLTLAGCVNDSSLSGDVYSASEAKQVQSVTYGTVVNARPVQIQGGDDNNVMGAIGGAVLGGFLGNTVGGGTGRSRPIPQPSRARAWASRRAWGRACRAG